MRHVLKTEKCYQKNDSKDLKEFIFKNYYKSIRFTIEYNYYSLKTKKKKI